LLSTLFKESSVSNVLVVLSIVVAVFGALDLLLSDFQKKALSNRSVVLWNWLDEAKRLPFLQLLRSKNTRYVLAGIGALIVGPLILQMGGDLQNKTALVAIGICILAIWMIPFTLAARSTLGTLLRATLFLALAGLPLLFDPVQADPDFKDLLGPNFGIAVATMFLVLLLWCVIAVPLFLIYSAIAILYVSEFLARRVAEYPKGVILAASVLFGSIVAILKVI
jgi:hypothetical protein